MPDGCSLKCRNFSRHHFRIPFYIDPDNWEWCAESNKNVGVRGRLAGVQCEIARCPPAPPCRIMRSHSRLHKAAQSFPKFSQLRFWFHLCKFYHYLRPGSLAIPRTNIEGAKVVDRLPFGPWNLIQKGNGLQRKRTVPTAYIKSYRR